MNIYDIAREAGVSIATVSRVLNGKPNVSPKTVKKVQDVLNRHNYTPSDIARGLVSRSMRLIGVVMEDIRNTHYANTAYTVEQELSKAGYHAILCNTGQDKQRYFRMLSGKQLDGLVLIGSVLMADEVRELIGQFYAQTPVVMVNGCLDLPNVWSVLCDDRHGIELCVQLMAERGRREIAYLHALDTPSAALKEEGLRIGMFRHGLTLREERVLHMDNTFACGEAAAAQVAAMDGVNAVICGEDLVAMGLIAGLTARGVRIPEDVAVTGYNNAFFGKLSGLKLTSVDNKLELMGTEAVRILCSVLAGNAVPKEMVIRPELWVGSST